MAKTPTIPTGLCFPWAGQFMLKACLEGHNAVLNHGTVEPPMDSRHPHAWVELDGRVYDWQTSEVGMSKWGQTPERSWPIDDFYEVFSPEVEASYSCDDKPWRIAFTSGCAGPWTPGEVAAAVMGKRRRGRRNPAPSPEEALRSEAFQALAWAQRGEPESAMHDMQMLGISQLYDWTCEHVGDLTNRMADRFHAFRGQYGTTMDKVDKTLRALTHSYGFAREVQEQIASNVRFVHEHPKRLAKEPYMATVELATATLREAGLRYAGAHAQLVVWNPLQWNARQAAVFLGRMEFATTVRFLRAMQALEDREAYEAFAGEFTGEPYERTSL